MSKTRLWFCVMGPMFLALAGEASADTYGNTNPFEVQSNHSPNFVLGVQVSIPLDDFEVQSFGMMYGHEQFGDPADSNAIFGLYSSGGDGLPDTLFAVTNPISLTTQQTYDNIAFTSPAVVASGTYWMMALYESGANPRMSLLDGGSLVSYWSNAYQDGMPSDAPSVTTYSGQNFNYWINGNVIPAPAAVALGAAAVLAGARRRRA